MCLGITGILNSFVCTLNVLMLSFSMDTFFMLCNIIIFVDCYLITNLHFNFVISIVVIVKSYNIKLKKESDWIELSCTNLAFLCNKVLHCMFF